MAGADLGALYPDAPRFRFGDNPALCADLTALVLAGTKRATCWPLRDMAKGEPFLSPGDAAIYTDWEGSPVLAVRFETVTIHRYNDVPEAFALAEGENDSLAGWRADHRTYFERNGGWAPDMELVCETFRVIARADGRAVD